MDIEATYFALRNAKTGELSINTTRIDINNKDGKGYTLLHFAAQSNDIEFAKELLHKGAIYNSKTEDGKTPLDLTRDGQIKELLENVRKFFISVKEGKCNKVSKYITDEKSLANVKDVQYYSALHWSVLKGYDNIVKLLLKSGTDVLQTTDKGYTPLHMTVARGNFEIAQLLLQNVPISKIFEFVNRQTYETKSTCLHISAKSGNLDIVYLLLKHGSIYNIKNKSGKTPYDLSKDKGIKDILKKTEDLFLCAKCGYSNLFSKINCLSSIEIEAVKNAHDKNENTILEELILNDHKNFASRLLELLKPHSVVKSGWKVRELERLESSAIRYFNYSKIYIPILENVANSDLFKVNPDPWKTLKVGSLFLQNVYILVDVYRKLRPGFIEDKNIQIISDTLNKFQFNPRHVTSGFVLDEYRGIATDFISKAEKYEYYYKLLHSKYRKNIKVFVEIAKSGIDAPANNFLKSIEEKTPLFPSYQLMKAIENNNEIEVIECIEKGADFNFINMHGQTPLELAVKFSNVKILRSLLERGANVQQLLLDGDTVLHVAVLNSTLSFYSRKDKLEAKLHPPIEGIHCLLKYGAMYNCRNENGETPFELSHCPLVRTLISTVDLCFKHARNGDFSLIPLLKSMDEEYFHTVIKARNKDGYTLLQLSRASGHKYLESKILELLDPK